MKELIESAEKLVNEELERANIKFPMFNSPHEGYAVIKEEIEEASNEIRETNCFLTDLWYGIKRNESDLKEYSQQIKNRATLLACEAIQVAAMAQKFIDSSKEG